MIVNRHGLSIRCTVGAVIRTVYNQHPFVLRPNRRRKYEWFLRVIPEDRDFNARALFIYPR